MTMKFRRQAFALAIALIAMPARASEELPRPEPGRRAGSKEFDSITPSSKLPARRYSVYRPTPQREPDPRYGPFSDPKYVDYYPYRVLVQCHDALGVDRDNGHLYILTIDRDPWNARFVAPIDLYVEYFESALPGRYDSTLHFRECAYRWRPLRREPLIRSTG